MAYTEQSEIEEINRALEVLKNGGVILCPTDTIWGFSCDATNETAVKKIFEIKQRSESKSMITLVANDAMLNKHITLVPEIAWDLIDVTDTPLTIIYSNPRNLAKNIISEEGTAAIRLVRTGFINQLITRFNRPIVSTSANISGKPSPASFNDIEPHLLKTVDYVINLPAEKQKKSAASAIIKIGLNNEVEIIRK